MNASSAYFLYAMMCGPDPIPASDCIVVPDPQSPHATRSECQARSFELANSQLLYGIGVRRFGSDVRFLAGCHTQQEFHALTGGSAA